MTDPVVEVTPAHVRVDPGQQARVTVTVRNQGHIVDGFRLTVLGDGPPDWATVDPPELRLLPGEKAGATVTFAPPGGTGTVGGGYPFAVLASSIVDAGRSAAAEGDVEVGALAGVSGTVTPKALTRRWHGRYDVSVTNRGNRPARLRLTTDPDDEHLAFLVLPPTVTLPVGGTARSQVRVRVRRPRLRGGTVRLPVRIGCEDAEGETEAAPLAEAVFAQRPILSRLVTTLATLVVVGAVAAAVLLVRAHSTPALAGLTSDQPGTPTLTATAEAAGQVRLAWSPVGQVDGYELTLPQGSSLALGGDVSWYPVAGLAPATEYCFQLRARRGAQASDFAHACVTTAATPVAPSGSPSAPSSVTPSLVPSSPLVAPRSTGGGTATSAASASPSASNASVASSAAVSATPPVSSAAACPTVATPNAAPVGADGPYPQFPAGSYIALDQASIRPVSNDPDGTAERADAAGRHVTAGTPRILDSLGVVGLDHGPESWFVYVGPFSTDAAATCFCDQNPSWTLCVAYPAVAQLPPSTAAVRPS